MTKNETQTITKEEFEKAMELRAKDRELQLEAINHDKQRLRIIEKQCDAQNRLTAVKERVTSTSFIWFVASVVFATVSLSAMCIRLCNM